MQAYAAAAYSGQAALSVSFSPQAPKQCGVRVCGRRAGQRLRQMPQVGGRQRRGSSSTGPMQCHALAQCRTAVLDWCGKTVCLYVVRTGRATHHRRCPASASICWCRFVKCTRDARTVPTVPPGPGPLDSQSKAAAGLEGRTTPNPTRYFAVRCQSRVRVRPACHYRT